MVWKSNPQGYDVFEFRIMDDLYSIYHDLKEMGWPLDNDDFMGIGDPEIANIKGQMQEVWLLYNFLLKDEKERIYKAFPNTIEWLVLNWPHFESLKKAKKAQKEIREFRKKGDDSGAWLQYLNLLGNQNYLLPQLALASNPPEHIGFCADKEGKVQALYKIGDKYYRENPSPKGMFNELKTRNMERHMVLGSNHLKKAAKIANQLGWDKIETDLLDIDAHIEETYAPRPYSLARTDADDPISFVSRRTRDV